MKQSIGVYQIKNTKNGELYIGSSGRNIYDRWACHLNRLRKNKHHSPILQNAWNTYGEDNFIFEILESTNTEEVLVKEQYYIDLLKPKYNCQPVAGSRLGQKLSEETKNKISQALKGRNVSEETRKKLREVSTGRKHSAETIEKLKNIPFTEERKLKISLAHQGKTLSEEHKQAILSANLGSKRTEEQKQNISNSLKGKQKSTEHIANNVTAHEKYEYRITCPDSSVEITRNLSEFCKKHNLSTCFYKYANGGYIKDKVFYYTKPEYKGYKIQRFDLEGNLISPTDNLSNDIVISQSNNASKRNIWLATSPNNIKYQINNLKEFCKEFDLNYGTIKTRLKVKGWYFNKTDYTADPYMLNNYIILNNETSTSI